MNRLLDGLGLLRKWMLKRLKERKEERLDRMRKERDEGEFHSGMVQGIGRSYAMRSRGLWIKANLAILLEAIAVHSGSNLSAPSDKEKFFLPNNSHPNP